ncbi:MAG: transglutaminase domain-containing protein [Spirochaetia bacterium]
MNTENTPQNKFKQILKKTALIPIFIFLLLLITYGVTYRLTGQPPIIDSITPRTATPGEVLVVTGDNFGAERSSGFVSISNVIPTASSYIEWTNTQISVRIPPDASSGLVYVETMNGKSEGVLFTNTDQIPTVVSGPVRPGMPYIESIEPESTPVGNAITILGNNFGINRESSRVLFSWVPGSQAGSSESNEFIQGRAVNFDYIYWSDREIQVRVPDGASSGNILVRTPRGESNSLFFEVSAPYGNKIYNSKRTYAMNYYINLTVTEAEPSAGLNIWLPNIYISPEQRNLQIISESPEPLFPDLHGLIMHSFENISAPMTTRVQRSVLFDRYAVETQIQPSDFNYATYDTESSFYENTTDSDEYIILSDRIRRIAPGIMGNVSNPYWKARRSYDYVLARLEFDPDTEGIDIESAIDNRRGNSFHYSALFCAVLRASGVPARPVSGIIIKDNQLAQRHHWAEFFLPNFGWVPADPAIGDSQSLENFELPEDASEYYFGNIDSRRIAFTHGIARARKIDPYGEIVNVQSPFSLQNIYIEEIRTIDYEIQWEDPVIMGIY